MSTNETETLPSFPTAAQMDAPVTLTLTVAQLAILALAVSSMVIPQTARLTMQVIVQNQKKTFDAIQLINTLTPTGAGDYLLTNPEQV